jgi:hypothetical protein
LLPLVFLRWVPNGDTSQVSEGDSSEAIDAQAQEA